MPNTRLDPEPQPDRGAGDIDLSRGHEYADIPFGAFVKSVAWLVVASVVLFALSYVSLFVLDRMENAERRSAAVRPVPRRDDEAKPNKRAINSDEDGEFSRRPTPLQPSPGHPRTPWKDMDLLRAEKNTELAEMGFRPMPDYANLWIPRRVIPPLLVEAVADFLRSMQSATQPATKPAAGAPANGGGS
jgi:hypothetical protein